jgi:hypothetical protein
MIKLLDRGIEENKYIEKLEIVRINKIMRNNSDEKNYPEELAIFTWKIFRVVTSLAENCRRRWLNSPGTYLGPHL